MKQNITLLLAKLALIFALVSGQANGFDFKGLDIHGAVSLTASYSDEYNYLGDTKGSFDLNNIETSVNGSYLFENGVQAGAQIYAYEIDGYTDITLDWATVTYQFNEYLGLRVGRNKLPLGIHNMYQDIDMIRPFVYLPAAIYPRDRRALTTAYDGLGIYGSFDAGNIGSIDYTANVGTVLADVVKVDNFINFYDNTEVADVTDWETGLNYGATLWWNTPLDGFRIGGSFITYLDNELTAAVKDKASLFYARSERRFDAVGFDMMNGDGAWDAMVAGTPATISADFIVSLISAEYYWNNWTFQAEYQNLHAEESSPGSPTNEFDQESYYIAATYRATDWLEAGTYYSANFPTEDDKRGASRTNTASHTAFTETVALALKADLTSQWLVKGEVQFNKGTNGIISLDGRNGDPLNWEEDWMFFTLRTTYSF